LASLKSFENESRILFQKQFFLTGYVYDTVPKEQILTKSHCAVPAVVFVFIPLLVTFEG